MGSPRSIGLCRWSVGQCQNIWKGKYLPRGLGVQHKSPVGLEKKVQFVWGNMLGDEETPDFSKFPPGFSSSCHSRVQDVPVDVPSTSIAWSASFTNRSSSVFTWKLGAKLWMFRRSSRSVPMPASRCQCKSARLVPHDIEYWNLMSAGASFRGRVSANACILLPMQKGRMKMARWIRFQQFPRCQLAVSLFMPELLVHQRLKLKFQVNWHLQGHGVATWRYSKAWLSTRHTASQSPKLVVILFILHPTVPYMTLWLLQLFFVSFVLHKSPMLRNLTSCPWSSNTTQVLALWNWTRRRNFVAAQNLAFSCHTKMVLEDGTYRLKKYHICLLRWLLGGETTLIKPLNT